MAEKSLIELHKEATKAKGKKINLKDRVDYKLPNGDVIKTHPENVKHLDAKYKANK